MNTVVRAEGLSKRVQSPEGKLTILDQVSFTIEQSQALAIVGVSGSGKSTLLGLLAGLDTPTEGRVVIADQDLNTLDEDGRARLRGALVGFVFQSFHLIPSLTAIENVALSLELSATPQPYAGAKAVLERVGLGERLKHYPSQLSGGEQQRVAIARAFASRPKLLFADEPTGNLDRKTAAVIVDLLFTLRREENTTLVLVTHDDNIAKRCDRILTLEAGVLVDRP